MFEFVKVFDDIICISEIKRVTVVYNNGTNYNNQFIHNVFIVFKDGTERRFTSTDLPTTKTEYENLQKSLLSYTRSDNNAE